MADVTIPDLTASDGSPDIDSLLEISEQTDPLSPTSEKLSLAQLLPFVMQTMTGFEDVDDATTASTPISGTAGNTYVMTNDAAGGNTNTDNLPNGFSSLWIPGTNSFDFSQLNIGDIVRIRLDAIVTTSAANQVVRAYLESNQSPGTPFSTEFINTSFKTAGAHSLNEYNMVYMGSSDVVNNPAQFKFTSDGSFDLEINGWVIEILRRSL